jgi:hypothetical protein
MKLFVMEYLKFTKEITKPRNRENTKERQVPKVPKIKKIKMLTTKARKKKKVYGTTKYSFSRFPPFVLS